MVMESISILVEKGFYDAIKGLTRETIRKD